MTMWPNKKGGPGHLRNATKLLTLICVFGLFSNLYSQKFYPYNLGFVSGESKLAIDTASGDTLGYFSFNGSSSIVADSAWDVILDDSGLDTSMIILGGFRFDHQYIATAFEQNLFVSKGFFGDYVELRWSIENYANQVSSFKIFRKKIGASGDSVQVANLPTTARVWQDLYAESGTMYRYTLYAEGIAQQNRKFLNWIDGVGFRIPTGIVSGRVTYSGGSAVQGVEIVAESNSPVRGSSIYLSGDSINSDSTSASFLAISHRADDSKFELEDEFTFQGWFRPDSGTSSIGTIFEKGSQYKLSYSPGNLIFKAGNDTMGISFTARQDTFFHFTAMKDSTGLHLFVMYDRYDHKWKSKNISATASATTDPIIIGKSENGEYLSGWIDEIRIWRSTFDKATLTDMNTRFIAGTEDKLLGYYRFSEATGKIFYDLSRKGFNYNQNHGALSAGVVWDTIIVPNTNQLAVRAITDNSGNYLLPGIPYDTDGNIFKIIPLYLNHGFNPGNQTLFIGPGSSVHNGIDFTDVSSFRVNGKVFYDSTEFPVEGAQVFIDGQLALRANGNATSSGSDGEFEVDVPIGRHYIELRKVGHGIKFIPDDSTYISNRFPGDDTTYNVQGPFTIQGTFIDTTRIKVIGRVTGGPREASKSLGLGRTSNNLGQARLKLSTSKGHKLTNNKEGDQRQIAHTHYQVDSLIATTSATGPLSTTMLIKKNNRGSVFIDPDPETGEFVAYLLPEKYKLDSVGAGRYNLNQSLTLDLTNAFSKYVNIDSSFSRSVVINPVTLETRDEYTIDSVNYNRQLDLIHRVTPSIDVKNSNGDKVFWETQVEVEDDSIISIVDSMGYPITKWPVFLQRKQYSLEIAVSEKYFNDDKGGQKDSVPVIDGQVEITNDMAIDVSRKTYALDEFGKVTYQFDGGVPKITPDYTKTLEISSLTGQNNSIKTEWQFQRPDSTGQIKASDFKGYVFGGSPTGNNFVTKGPNQVRMILRDPQGSGSSTTFSTGNTVTTAHSLTLVDKLDNNLVIDYQKGSEFAAVIGAPGAATIKKVEINSSDAVGYQNVETWTSDNSYTISTTNTKTWSTSSSPSFDGADGDVFIGYSSNIVYGISRMLGLVPLNKCLNDCRDTLSGFAIGLNNGLRMDPQFDTEFQFTQKHIETELIPNLKLIRDLYMLNSPYHTADSSHQYGTPSYASANTSYRDTVYINGQTGDTIYERIGDKYSYSYSVPGDFASDTEFSDSVLIFNQQIENWIGHLARNEREKLQGAKITNISYSSGADYTSSVSYDTTGTFTESFEWNMSSSLASEAGITIDGKGVTFKLNNVYSSVVSDGSANSLSSGVSFSYTLSDPDVGDYLSIDVKKPKSNTGPIFEVKGGQTKCNYKGQVTTKYFSPGSIISQATSQRENPDISATNFVLNNVPADQPANFPISLGNVSQTNDDNWYEVRVDQGSNPDGARILMDGVPIGNGIAVFIPALSTISKVISIEKLQGSSVNDYLDIGIILASQCEPTTIADTIFLTARFTPVCSKVNISQPNNLWLRNTTTGSNLQIKIDGYDLNLTDLERIEFQYKPSSSSSWTTVRKFFKDSVGYQNYIASNVGATDAEVIVGNEITFIWDLSSEQDRLYDIRATSYCLDPNTNPNHTEVLRGIKDMKPPRVFGTPQPGDGILSHGEDISVAFNEPIQTGLLLSTNFSARAVLNGTPLNHDRSIHLDGSNDYLSIPGAVDLTNRSFTIQFWVRRLNQQAGIICQQSELEIGFDTGNHLYVQLGNQMSATIDQFNTTTDWIHFTVTFDNNSNNLNVYRAIDDGLTPPKGVILNQNIPLSFNVDGQLYIGSNANKTQHFNGLIHDFRVWDFAMGGQTAKSTASTHAKLIGNEVGLISFWPMTELSGSLAYDKVRSHHAILKGASWRAEPAGYAWQTTASSALSIPGSYITIDNSMDMTLEFWFKGSSQNDVILFSNGRGDTTEPVGSREDIWNIGVDPNGVLYASNNGIILPSTSGKSYLDGTWHHLALTLNRRSNTSLYIDGNLEASTNSASIGGLKSNEMTLGARRHYTTSTPYDKSFNGYIDEVRIWRLFRPLDLINDNMHNRVNGDEIGLVAYYPFDYWNTTFNASSTSLANYDLNDYSGNSSGDSANTVGTGGGFTNGDIPAIAAAKPEVNLTVDDIASTDKIIITIQDLINQPSSLEKQVVTLTVRDIEDLNGNVLTNPVTWTAYVRQNSVIWEKQSLWYSKKVYDTLSIKVVALNISGLSQNYSVSNIPSWLTLKGGITGSMGPASSKTLEFEVNPALNIGTYEEVIYLTSDFGFSEPLYVTVKVEGTPPNWSVDPNNYQYSMNIIGRIKVDGIVSTDEDDMLVAMVNDTVRGMANLEYFPAYDAYLVFMDVYSNIAGGESVDFVVWDASNGKVHTEVTPTLLFQNNTLQGSPSVPVDFEAINTYYEPIDVAQGWNWISFHLDSRAQDTVDALLESISPVDGDILKGHTNYDQYSSSLGWTGTITSNGGVSPTEMYKLRISADDTIDYVGSKVDPGLHPIPIDSGWNWIGFISQNNMTVANAFSFYNAAHGDLLKGQLSFVVYDSILGWVGNLGFMQSKHGYMYLSHKSDTLRYPDSDLFNYKNAFDQDQVYLNHLLALNEHNFRYNMNIIATAPLCEDAPEGSYILVAHKDDEVRGVSRSQRNGFFMTLYGDGPPDDLHFTLVSEFGDEYDISEHLEFSPNTLMGSIDDPVYFTSGDTGLYDCSAYRSIAELDASGVAIFPTSFSDHLEFQFEMPEDGELSIELYDVSGRHINTLLNGQFKKGFHHAEWKANARQQSLAAGVYMVHVTRGNELPVVRRLVKVDE